MERGRPKNIESPEEMWAHFEAYKTQVKANPIRVVEQKKGNISIPKDFKGDKLPDPIIEMPVQRPLTYEGFVNYLADIDIVQDADDYFRNKNGSYGNFSAICKRIRNVIRQDQIEGGMAGIYNPSITQRLNNLVEKQEVTTTKKKVFKIGYKKPDELDSDGDNE
jgi:hypothetical protein